MTKSPTTVRNIAIGELSKRSVTLHIVGDSPLYCNSMNAKGRRTLLLPEVMGRKTRAERAVSLKHQPVEEFRASVYRSADGPTRLLMPAPAFKGAMMTAALDMPGTRKTEIGRLVWVQGTHVPIWGVPQLKMDVVRSADMAKTPDVRTRAYLPEWASRVTIVFLEPNLSAGAVINLLAAAGALAGIGDFRQEKGKGSYGQFRIVAEGANDADYLRIVSGGGADAQDEALAHPVAADADTEEMLGWYSAEVINLHKASADGEETEEREAA